MWLCDNKTLFTQTGSSLTWSMGLSLSTPGLGHSSSLSTTSLYHIHVLKNFLYTNSPFFFFFYVLLRVWQNHWLDELAMYS